MAATPFDVANGIAHRLYPRLEDGGDLHLKLEELISQACADTMREIGVPFGVDGFERTATALFTNTTRCEAAISQAIVEHVFRSTADYLTERKVAA